MSRARPIVAAAVFAALAACGSTPPPAQQSTRPPITSAAPATTTAVPSAPAASSSSSTDLPPLPEVPFAPARPMPVVEEVYRFAAAHPEVLSHIPCFCGCESRGHKHNDDCFVAARDGRGRVTAWEPHGLG